MANHELYQRISTLDRFLITVVVMSATLMQVIDTTIVNVALPHMQGALSASADEITWALTSYLISSAIFMPLTGFFTDKLGSKTFLIVSIVGFTLVSALCGASVSLTEIVFFRFLQGLFGAGLVPLSQSILASIFPPEERGKAMAIWGIGVMVGPILGPTLGGYLTEYANWRWTFYVNVPIGAFTLLLAYVVPDTEKKGRLMDWPGLFFLILAIGGLQYVLDRGNRDDWFQSANICFITYLAIAGLLGFFIHSSKKNSRHVFDLKIFADKNFTLASILLFFLGLGLYGMMVMQPLMMEKLLNYPAFTAGLMMAPRGISGMLSMLIVGRIIARVDSRWLIIIGCLISAFGTSLGTRYSLTTIDQFWLIIPMLLQGFGLGMVFVPLSTIAYSTLPTQLRAEAAGLFSLLRTLGSSMGISIAITLYTRNAQVFWQQLGAHINPYNSAFHQYLQAKQIALLNPTTAAQLSNQLAEQAAIKSFINVFAFIAWCFIVMIPFTLLLKDTRKTRKEILPMKKESPNTLSQ